MQPYIDIIRPLKGQEKIDRFAEVIEILNLKDEAIELMAWKCGFMLTENIKGNYGKKETIVSGM